MAPYDYLWADVAALPTEAGKPGGPPATIRGSAAITLAPVRALGTGSGVGATGSAAIRLATVRVTASGPGNVNPTPVITCVNDPIDVTQGGQPVTVNLVANDTTTDPPLTVTGVQSVAQGGGGGSRTWDASSITYTPPGAGGYSGTFALRYDVQSNSGVTATGQVDITVRTSGQVADQFWKKLWAANAQGAKPRAPRSNRPFNVGIFGSGTGDGTFYNTKMSYYPEIVGGNMIARYARCANWNEWMGGAVNVADIEPAAGTMWDIQTGPHNGPWARDNLSGVTSARTWTVVMFTTLPGDADRADALDYGASGNNRARWARGGERLRKQLVRLGRDLDLVVGRPNWEGMNQTTALKLGGPTSTAWNNANNNNPTAYSHPSQWYAKGLSTDQYNEHMSAFCNAFWQGYQQRMPMALSPAGDSYSEVYLDPDDKAHYDGWMEADIYDLCCGSWHCRDDRTSTVARARAFVAGTSPFAADKYNNATPPVTVRGNGWCQPQHVFDMAVKYDKVACFFEWGPYNVGQAVDTGAENFNVAINDFGDLCDTYGKRNRLAFTNLLNMDCINPNWGTGKSPARLENDWRLSANALINKFEKFVPPPATP